MTINGFNPNNPLLRGYNTIIYPPVLYEPRGEPKQDDEDELLPAGGIVAGIAGVLVLLGLLLLAGNALAGSEDCRQLLQRERPGDRAENRRTGPQRDPIKGANPPRIVPCPTAESVQPCDDERERTLSRGIAPYIEVDLSARDREQRSGPWLVDHKASSADMAMQLKFGADSWISIRDRGGANPIALGLSLQCRSCCGDVAARSRG